MTEISELERRLTAALDRIGAGLERVRRSEGSELEAELAAEREANAQLEERVRAIRETQETTVAALKEEVGELRKSIAGLDQDLQRMRSVNSSLRRSNAALREANAEGLADATLINQALEAENASLKALRETDRGDIDRVLRELDPMLLKAENA